jgi:CheY-like chemotaxis protein
MSHNRALPQATVLVVEDNALIMMASVQTVEDAGYLTLECSNSAAAIRLMETHSEISILFTDIEMPPGEDGLWLARSVRERWPLVTMVIASGRVCPLACDMPTEAIFLRKPYPEAALVDALAGLH